LNDKIKNKLKFYKNIRIEFYILKNQRTTLKLCMAKSFSRGRKRKEKRKKLLTSHHHPKATMHNPNRKTLQYFQ
jgi:hypothetical protein